MGIISNPKIGIAVAALLRAQETELPHAIGEPILREILLVVRAARDHVDAGGNRPLGRKEDLNAVGHGRSGPCGERGDSLTPPSILNLGCRQGTAPPQLKQGIADSNFLRFPYETRRTPLYRNAGLALAGVRCAQSSDQGMSQRR